MSATAFAWPDGNRIAVIVTVLLENWSEGKAPPYGPMTTSLKPGTYDRAGVTWSQYGGREGIWRLVRILHDHGINATVCANIKSIEMYPQAMKTVLEYGHEIAAHSYTQDKIHAYMEPAEEEQNIRDCKRIFEEQLGHPPLGWLSPVVAATDRTAEFLAQEGFLWHGDYNDADLPRMVETPKGSIVGMPHTDFADNRVLRQSPSDYLNAYQETFDYLYRHEPGSLINLTLHCQFGARPLIASVFNKILHHFKQFPDVWYPRHDELASWFKNRGFIEVTYAERFFSE